jgi:serine/threonine protein kinase
MMVPGDEALVQAEAPAQDQHDDATVMMSDSGPSGTAGVIERPEAFRPLDELRQRVRQPTPGAFGGRYERDTILGRGGMGEVWTTRDLHLEREVALKRMRGGGESDDTIAIAPSEAKLARFLREAQLTGSLEHPNIVPVYDLGLDESGGLFFTMKRMRGDSLAELIQRDETGSLLQRLDVFRKICDAMAFAHAHGVIHRDLKPDNVMIGEFGEVIVLDWGLAKRIDGVYLPDEQSLDEPTGQPSGRTGPPSSSQRHPPAQSPGPARDVASGPRSDSGLRSGSGSRSSTLTQAGAVIGTPAFMAPEQALGKLDDLDARTDIYALGVLLYNLLTGQRPFEGTVSMVIEAVSAGRFDPPSRKRPLPRELDAIVCTAMALQPAARYPSVEALRADIQAFLEGHPVSVLRYGWARRLGKWAGRNRRLLTGIGLTAALGLTGLLVEGLVYLRDVEAERARVVSALAVAEDARQVAEAARGRAELAEREAAIRAADAEVGLALSLVQQDDLLAALDKLDTATAGYEQAGASEIRASLARAHVHGQNPGPVFRAELPAGAKLDALAPDGRAIAWHVGERVVVVDWVTGEHLIDRQIAGLVDAPVAARSVIAVDDEFIVARHRNHRGDDRLELLALRRDELVGSVPASSITKLIIGTDGQHVLLQGQDGRVRGWDVHAGTAIGPGFECADPRVSNDVGRVLCRPDDMALHSDSAPHTIWDTRSGQALGTVDSSTGVNLSPTGDAAIFSREHQGLRLVGVDGQQRWYLGDGKIGGSAIFSDDGRRIFSHGIHEINWLSAEGEVLGRRRARGQFVDIDAEGRLVLASNGQHVEIWSTGPGAHVPTMQNGGVLRDFNLATDELLAVAVDLQAGVLVHDPLSGKSLVEFELGGRPSAAVFDAGGRLAVAGRAAAEGDRSIVVLHELARQTEPTQQLVVEQPVMDLAFARGDREVLVALLGGEVLRWDLAGDRIVGRFDVEQTPWQLQVSPDGELVYIAGRDDARPEVEVWDVANERRVFATAALGPAYAVTLSPTGDRFTVANHMGRPQTWALGSSTLLAEYPALGLPVMHLAYTTDGTLLYVGSYDGKGRIFDTRDQTELLLLPLGVAAPIMSHDGRTLLGCGSRFVLDLAERERSLALDLDSHTNDPGRRALQLVDALVLQQDWDSAARALEWAADMGAKIPRVLAGRIAWARGDAAGAASDFAEAVAAGERRPSVAIWARLSAAQP